MKQDYLELYVDYLISSFDATTATGLSGMLDGGVSHDAITRMLSSPSLTSKDLWLRAKPLVREIESDDGVLIIDDSLLEKPSTDESALICYHYDHSKGRIVKGINFLSALYHSQGATVPVGVHLVMKSEYETDLKTGRRKRKALFTKNQYCRLLMTQAAKNQLRFRYVLTDSWFASSDNMMCIHHELKRHFIMALKSNRKVALSLNDKRQGRYVRIDSLSMDEGMTRDIWLESVDFPLVLAKQVFTNEDDSTGVLYLVSNDIELSNDQIATLYQKRWNVECYHKSLKQNASLGKSPTQTRTTQTNHFFASLYAYIRLEQLRCHTQLNHFALKSKLYIKAIQRAFDELRLLKNSLTA